METFKYPTTYELEEVFSKFTTARFVKQFAKKMGILMPNASRSLLAKELSLFFYDNDDIIKIHNEAYQKNYKNTLAGFIINSDDSDFDLIASIEGLKTRGDTEGMKLDTPRLISNPKKPEIYQSRLEYNKQRIGRMEFLQSEKTEFDFYIKKQEDNWLIEIDSKRSNDPAMVKKIFNNIRRKINIEEIKDILTTAQTIIFFDLLAKKGMQVGDWVFSDVTQLNFKKDKIVIDDDENEKEASATELKGIKKALLDGHNLRENPFVKSSEKSGYRFTAMTYQYSSSKTPHIIQIKAEFKGNPKVFEVSVTEYGERHGKKEEVIPITLDKKEDLFYRSHFWNNAKKIYFDLLKDDKK